ncbi:MAG: DUF805 domain-containing protein [Sphingomonas bacterium]|nr:DUF805 domain-containing protein [Sphingomonas bacterium]
MSPIDWATRPLTKYADFSGRAPRAEYWWFYLLSIVAYIVATIVDSVIGTGAALGSYGILSLVVMLGLVIPSLAAGVRRLHDTDRSGWWMLIVLVPLVGAIVLLVFFVLEGTKDDNRFGPNPYSGELGYA